MLELWPAIDIIHGKPVRLLKGDFTEQTDYSDKFSFERLAEIFSGFGHGIHVVDLEGAGKNSLKNLEAIKTICRFAKIPVEVGGGIRTIETIHELLSLGVSRVILGTAAVLNPEFMRSAVKRFGPEKVVLGVDAKDGFVATHGWKEHSVLPAEDMIAYAISNAGIKTIIFTDINTDGTLGGPPIDTFQKLVERFLNADIIASGGVSCIDDITKLKKTGVKGVIFGKSFYEEKITVEELQDFSQKS